MSKRKSSVDRAKTLCPSEGGRLLDLKLDELDLTKADGEVRVDAARGLFSRLISGERRPGRALGQRLFMEFGIDPSLWDVRARTSSRRGTGTDG